MGCALSPLFPLVAVSVSVSIVVSITVTLWMLRERR